MALSNRSKTNKGGNRRHPLTGSLRLVMWILLLLIAGGAGAATGGLLGYLEAVAALPELEYYRPPLTTRVVDRSGKVTIAEFYEENRELLSLSEMPWALADAFISIEDERFRAAQENRVFSGHFGLDVRGIFRAMLVNTRKGSARQGASTITQQLSRNVLRRRVGHGRTLERKLREALVALQIEHRYSKDQILEFYLNHIFLGHNSYGVQSAAHTYFGKDARQLTVGECAALASIPKSPTKINPLSNPEKLKARRNLVLNKMYKLGSIDSETLQREVNSPLNTHRDSGPRTKAPYFIDYMRSDLSTRPGFGEDLLTREGYRVQSTVNPQYQQILEKQLSQGLARVEEQWQESKADARARELRQLREEFGSTRPVKGHRRLARILQVTTQGGEIEIGGYRGFAKFRTVKKTKKSEKKTIVPYYNPDLVLKSGEYIDVVIEAVSRSDKTISVSLYDRKHIQGAAILLDVRSGQILALAGGSDFYDRQNDGMWNRGTRGARQPGSAFKPLLYAAAIENGWTAGRIIMDDRVVYGNGIYTPRNYSNRYYGPMTLWRALSRSNNVVTVKLFKALGFKKSFATYRRFNILNNKRRWKLRPELALCLGSLDVTPLSLAAAYLPFARQGLGIEPMSVIGVDHPGGTGGLDSQLRPRERQVISPQTAYIVTRMLMDVVKTGTARNSIGPYFDSTNAPEIAGKTGTTSNCADAWFVGYTPQLVLVVYVGFDRRRSLGPAMTGSHVAAPIWRGIMKDVLATRDDWQKKFTVPDNLVFRDISSRTGLLAAPEPHGDESVLRNVPFVKGTEPTQVSMGYEGFPHWRYQHPNPKKNKIEDPEQIPPELWTEYYGSASGQAEQLGPVGRLKPAVPGPDSGSKPIGNDLAPSAEPVAEPENDFQWLIAPPWEFQQEPS